MTTRRSLAICAFAKINLSLRVLGVRPDGYHELRTVLQTLDLHDRLTVETSAGPFTLVCDDTSCPTDERNLVWRAAALVWRTAGRRSAMTGVRVRLDKRIPTQGGLGGGSSDAAAALRLFARIWAPDLTQAALAGLARSLGADVPFFLTGGTALGVERGDRLFPLADPAASWVVLARPDFGVSTADAYRWLDEQTDRPGPRRATGPYGEGGNDLEPPVARRHPEIGRLVRTLRRQGAGWAAMSGSGSVCFGLFASARAATSAARAIASPRVTTFVTRTLSASEYLVRASPFRAALPRR